MNKKFINGLVLLGAGILIMVAGICFVAYFFSLNSIPDDALLSKSHYIAAGFTCVGFVMCISGCITATIGFGGTNKKNTQMPSMPVAVPGAVNAQAKINTAPTGMQTVSFSFCGNCGKRNIAGNRFCEGCGEVL